jgi:hypothetical protein
MHRLGGPSDGGGKHIKSEFVSGAGNEQLHAVGSSNMEEEQQLGNFDMCPYLLVADDEVRIGLSA